MTDMVFVKRGKGFYPADPVTEQYAAQTSEGTHILATVRKPRSPKQNRFVHALLGEVIKHTDRFADVEDLKRFLMLRCRMYELVAINDGRFVISFPSLKFGSMDQFEFQRVFDRWKWVIVNEILIGVDPIVLETTILSEIA